MMRAKSLFLTFVAVFAATDAAVATIDFLPSGKFTVSARPRFLTTGRFDRDSLDDIALAARRSDEVQVIVGSSTGEFQRGTVTLFGRQLEQAASGDLNRPREIDGTVRGDEFDDLVVADVNSDGVWILLGNGNGTFRDPYLVPIGRVPRFLALGDFDNDNDTDIAITDRPRPLEAGRVHVLLNDGDANLPGFRLGADLTTELRPEDIVAADYNTDGRLDIAVLNKGGPRVKSVSVFLNAGLDPTGQVARFQESGVFSVGENPRRLLTADLNGDGVFDLALLNDPIGQPTSEIAILFSRNNGFFDGPVKIQVPCPTTSNDIICTAKAIAAGDFDQDGSIDFAVTGREIREQANIFDFMTVFRGRGDGRFTPKQSFNTDVNPDLITVGDYTGDGFPDLGIATLFNLSIQMYVNISTIPDPIGFPCNEDDDCVSEACENGICCNRRCDEGESCAVCGSEGECTPLLPEGEVCIIDIRQNPGDEPDLVECDPACLSGFCTDGVCCTTDFCEEGARCDVGSFSGMCHELLPPGSTCEDDMDCAPIRQTCGGEPRVCSASGAPCNVTADCADEFGYCVDGICCRVAACAPDEACLPPEGRCGPIPTPTPTPRGRGQFCERDEECERGLVCTDGVCCEVNRCPAGFFCAPVGEPEATPGQCAPGTPRPTRTRTPTRIPSSTPTLQPCPDGFERVGDACVKSDRGGGCAIGSDGGGSWWMIGLPLLGWFWRRRPTSTVVTRELR